MICKRFKLNPFYNLSLNLYVSYYTIFSIMTAKSSFIYTIIKNYFEKTLLYLISIIVGTIFLYFSFLCFKSDYKYAFLYFALTLATFILPYVKKIKVGNVEFEKNENNNVNLQPITEQIINSAKEAPVVKDNLINIDINIKKEQLVKSVFSDIGFYSLKAAVDNKQVYLYNLKKSTSYNSIKYLKVINDEISFLFNYIKNIQCHKFLKKEELEFLSEFEKNFHKQFYINQKDLIECGKSLIVFLIFRGLNIVLENDSDYKKAIKYNKIIISLYPRYAIPYNFLGFIYENQENYKKAEFYYKKAILYKPDYIEAYNNLGILYLKLKDYSKSENCFKNTIKLDNKYTHGYNNLGEVYLLQKDYKNAEKFYKRAIEITPKYQTGYFNLGNTYFEMEKYDDAENFYNKAMVLDPNDAEVYFKLGLLYQSKKNEEKAKEFFEKASKFNANKI